MLFSIIFLWTPPHFWALALLKSDDYRRAGVPMLPVVAGEDATRLQILLYTLVLAPAAVLPAIMGFAGPLYGVVAAARGAWMIALAVRVYRAREGDAARKAAITLFLSRSSISSCFSRCCCSSRSSGLDRLSWVASAAVRMRRRSGMMANQPDQGAGPGPERGRDAGARARSRWASCWPRSPSCSSSSRIAKLGGNVLNRPL